MKKVLPGLLLILLLIPFLNLLPAAQPTANDRQVTLALTQPRPAQIWNLVELYERDLLPLQQLRLIGVFHEDEIPGYHESEQFVKQRELDWVEFFVIRGRVPEEEIFRENAWTDQFKELFNRVNGFVFTGGADIPPALYGAASHLMTEASTPERSRYEISLLYHLLGRAEDKFRPLLAARPGMPVLAICLGMQSLNVALGGTLVQDIPMQVYGLQTVEDVLSQENDRIHSALYRRRMLPEADLPPALHRINLEQDGFFRTRLGLSPDSRPYVLSSHHQAVEKLGSGLKVTATSLDGRIVEAVVHQGFKNVVGVQFHPEAAVIFQKRRFFTYDHQGKKQPFQVRAFINADQAGELLHRRLWHWLAESLLAGR